MKKSNVEFYVRLVTGDCFQIQTYCPAFGIISVGNNGSRYKNGEIKGLSDGGRLGDLLQCEKENH